MALDPADSIGRSPSMLVAAAGTGSQTARARKEGTVEFGPPRPSRARRAAAPTRARATDVYNPSKNQFSLRPIRLLDSQTGLARMSEKIQPVFKWSNLIGRRENWFLFRCSTRYDFCGGIRYTCMRKPDPSLRICARFTKRDSQINETEHINSQ